MKKQSFFASCPLKLEDFLLTEVKKHDGADILKVHGGVRFKMNEGQVLKFLHHSRIASRVFKLLDVYPVKNQDDLYEKVKNKWWHRVLDLDQTFKITTLLDPDAAKLFGNTMHLNRVVKDAIVDQYREEKGERPSVETDRPDYPFLVRIESRGKKDGFNALVYVDICGAPLSDRGYRMAGHQAPLRENLAAALVYQTNWDKQVSFYDPMCGTGTIILEACMIKMGLPPSYIKILRMVDTREKPYAYQNQNWYRHNSELVQDHQNWLVSMADEIEEKLEKNKPSNLYASDIRIDKIKNSIKAAHLQQCIKVAQVDALHLQRIPEEDKGILICNPPYGERMGDQEEVNELYYQFGQVIKNHFKGYRVFIFSLGKGPISKIHMKTKQKTPFLNGQLDCRLFEYNIF